MLSGDVVRRPPRVSCIHPIAHSVLTISCNFKFEPRSLRTLRVYARHEQREEVYTKFTSLPLPRAYTDNVNGSSSGHSRSIAGNPLSVRETRSRETRRAIQTYLGGALGEKGRLDRRQRLIREAIRYGKTNGMRLWSDQSSEIEVNAETSLSVLLCEKITYKAGKSYTGRNATWVLDLWDGALEWLLSDSPLALAPTATVMVERADEILTGVQVEAPDIGAETGMLIISAYTDRNAGAIMRLAQQTGLGMRLIKAYNESDDDAIVLMAEGK